MKLASYRDGAGASFGVVTDSGLVDIGRREAARWPTLRAAIEAGALAEIADIAAGATADVDGGAIDWLPPVPNPGHILCAGRNYRDHVLEMGGEIPTHPTFFSRHPNTLVAHEAPLVRPRVSTNLDFEGELAFVLARGGRHIDPADALDHIAGYACFNDGSVRDWQKHSTTAGKNFVGSGPFGPWLVTPDEVGDPGNLTIETRVNGTVMQHSSTDQLIFDIPALIAYASAFSQLEAADVFATGSPHGVAAGRDPSPWLEPGDTVELEIENIGILRNPVIAED